MFNLAEKTMVSVLHEELGYKMKKHKYKKLEVMQPRIKNQFKLQVGEQTIPDKCTRSFTLMISIDKYSLSFISED